MVEKTPVAAVPRATLIAPVRVATSTTHLLIHERSADQTADVKDERGSGEEDEKDASSRSYRQMRMTAIIY